MKLKNHIVIIFFFLGSYLFISTKSLEKLSFDRLFPQSKFEVIYKKTINLYNFIHSDIEFTSIEKYIFNELLDIYVYTSLCYKNICECCKIQDEYKDLIYAIMQHNFEIFNNKFRIINSDKKMYINLIFQKILSNSSKIRLTTNFF